MGLIIAAPAARHFGVHAALVGCGLIATMVTIAALASPEVRQLRSRLT